MVTPLLDEGTLDAEGTEKLVEHLISGGVHGVFLLGTTGEGPSLSRSLRVDLVKTVCDQVNGRIPVWVGLMDSSYRESVKLAEKAKELGAQAVVLAPPSFYKIDQDQLYDLVDQLLDDISLPLYLYNNPGVTQATFGLETVERLLEREEVRGIKDSSGDMIYYQRLKALARQTDTTLYMGPEELLMESLIMGGSGGVPGGANIFPELYVGMYQAVTSGELDRAHTLQQKIMQRTSIFYSGNGYIAGRVINGIKSALAHMGICSDYVAKPLSKAENEKVQSVEEFLDTQL